MEKTNNNENCILEDICCMDKICGFFENIVLLIIDVVFILAIILFFAWIIECIYSGLFNHTDNKEYITVCVTIVTGLIFYRRNNLANIVSKSRSEYINKLRDAATAFNKSIYHHLRPNEKNIADDILVTYYHLISFLNSADETKIDCTFINKANAIVSEIKSDHSTNKAKVETMVGELNEYLQAIINLEWQGIKKEINTSIFHVFCVTKLQNECIYRFKKIANKSKPK